MSRFLCTCAKPNLHPTPSQAAKRTCVQCNGFIPLPVTKPLVLVCERCRHRFNPDIEGRAGVYIDRGGSGAERLKGQEVIQLCGDCAATLRSFLRLRPDELYR